MKILHTADWHLGKRLEKVSRFEEQKQVLDEIIEITETAGIDLVLIAGDLFDNFNPASEAAELLYSTLKRLADGGKRPVVAIAGNHDSPDRIEVPDALARECGILFAGYPDTHIREGELCSDNFIVRSEPGFVELKLSKYPYPIRLLLTPYANEYRVKTFLGLENTEEDLRQLLERRWKELADKYCDEEGVNVLISHLYVMKKGEIPPEEPDEEKPILHVGGAQAVYSENIPSQIQYAALGHLHRFQQIDLNPCPVVYSSSPLCYSFSEAGQKKYVVIIDAEPSRKVVYNKIELKSGKPLYRKRFDAVDDALLWLNENPNSLVELTIVSDEYLTADDRKRLMQAHNGIVSLIPEIKNAAFLKQKDHHIDLNKDMDELFCQYFLYKYGQMPNEELVELFKEIRAEQTEE